MDRPVCYDCLAEAKMVRVDNESVWVCPQCSYQLDDEGMPSVFYDRHFQKKKEKLSQAKVKPADKKVSLDDDLAQYFGYYTDRKD